MDGVDGWMGWEQVGGGWMDRMRWDGWMDGMGWDAWDGMECDGMGWDGWRGGGLDGWMHGWDGMYG